MSFAHQTQRKTAVPGASVKPKDTPRLFDNVLCTEGRLAERSAPCYFYTMGEKSREAQRATNS